jgi:hypothetical protein
MGSVMTTTMFVVVTGTTVTVVGTRERMLNLIIVMIVCVSILQCRILSVVKDVAHQRGRVMVTAMTVTIYVVVTGTLATAVMQMAILIIVQSAHV